MFLERNSSISSGLAPNYLAAYMTNLCCVFTCPGTAAQRVGVPFLQEAASKRVHSFPYTARLISNIEVSAGLYDGLDISSRRILTECVMWALSRHSVPYEGLEVMVDLIPRPGSQLCHLAERQHAHPETKEEERKKRKYLR